MFSRRLHTFCICGSVVEGSLYWRQLASGRAEKEGQEGKKGDEREMEEGRRMTEKKDEENRGGKAAFKNRREEERLPGGWRPDRDMLCLSCEPLYHPHISCSAYLFVSS